MGEFNENIKFYFCNNYYNGYNPHLKSSAQKNSISFKSKGPRGFKPVVKTVKKVIRPHIINSLYGELPKNIQSTLENMHTNIDSINNFFHKLSTNPVKAEKIKNNYPDLVRKQKKKGIIFNLDNEEGTITILRNRNKNTLLRLIINNQNGENHFLIDGYDKIVANLNKKNPTILPPKLRYMTSTEINSSGVKQYIEIAGRKISDYTQYLKSFDNGIKPSITTVPNANESLKKILTIFEGKGENLPDNLRLLVSPNNNKVLAFNLKTSDGGELKVSKKVSSEYKEDLRYLSFEETLPDGAKKFLSIDLLTNDFLKTGLKGKPVVINDKVLSYTPAELKEYGIKNSFNR